MFEFDTTASYVKREEHNRALKHIRELRNESNNIIRYIAIIVVCLVLIAMFLLYALVKISILDDDFSVDKYAAYNINLADHPEAILIPLEVPEVFVPYDVPFDNDFQKYVCELADSYGVPREIAFGVMWAESGYNPTASSCGLMGITNACEPQMKQLGVTDLLDPYQNASVGIMVLADKLKTYDTTEKALMAYNAGNGKAHEVWFSKGIYSTEYSRKVLAKAWELSEV